MLAHFFLVKYLNYTFADLLTESYSFISQIFFFYFFEVKPNGQGERNLFLSFLENDFRVFTFSDSNCKNRERS